MAIISKPNTLTDGNKVYAAEHNSNYDTIYNDYNGNIDSTNIKAGAIVNSNINASAAIDGTKISPDFGSQNINTTGDIYTVALVSSSSFTTTGWTVTGTALGLLYYKKIGKLVFINFILNGTSNSGTTNFTVPYASSSIGINFFGTMGQCIDNGVTLSYPTYAVLSPASTTVLLYKQVDGTTYTNLGTKTIQGQLLYTID